ncbi:phosphatidylcholine transfer protein isoform X3 [Narcine bancroftii]|uniref:phosphatidylcholine transfer protein isoform X3 n=1 Tax=Narcine bancroftii TaxID=1343680 RepID=UPI003831E71C
MEISRKARSIESQVPQDYYGWVFAYQHGSENETTPHHSFSMQLEESIQVIFLFPKKQESCLYEYKIYGTFTDFAPELFVDVYMDLEYRKQWDSYVKELYELEHCGEKLIYWEVKYPFLLSNRDYVYRRELHDLDINGRKIWVISAKSKCVPGLPAKSGMIRVEDYHQTVVIESDVFLHYFDNPGGMIPTFLINWAAKADGVLIDHAQHTDEKASLEFLLPITKEILLLAGTAEWILRGAFCCTPVQEGSRLQQGSIPENYSNPNKTMCGRGSWL